MAHFYMKLPIHHTDSHLLPSDKHAGEGGGKAVHHLTQDGRSKTNGHPGWPQRGWRERGWRERE